MARYTTTYDKDRDYQALINDAVANQDYESAAVYEQQRNAKISGEGITDYQPTNNWEKYLPKQQTRMDNTPYIKTADNDYTKYTQQADQFDALLNGLQGKMMNREAFSYDPENDPLYAVYRDLYTKNGQNAMNDTLAQISARTGGLASSYAGQAAQGAYNRYMDQLNAAVPELRNLAYQMYRDNVGDDMDMFGLISGRQGRADNLGQNAWDNSYRERNMQADLAQQAINNEFNQMQWDYQTGNDAMDRARGEIDAYLAAGGSAAGIPADLLQAAGYSNAYLAAMENAYAQKNAGKSAGGGSESGKWDDVDAWVEQYGEDAAEQYIRENYRALGYKTVSEALAGYQNHLTSSGNGENGGNGNTTMEDALEMLENYGVNKTPLTEEQWKLQNQFNSSAVVPESYSDYLDAFVAQYTAGKKPVNGGNTGGNGGGKTDIQKIGTAQGDGALRWNGRNYPISDYGINALINDINSANLSDSEMDAIINRLNYLGFNAG